MSQDLPPVQGLDWTREQRVAWCKQRAAAEPWHLAANSMIGDMELMGIPLSPETVMLGTMEGASRGEAGVRDWIDGIH